MRVSTPKKGGGVWGHAPPGKFCNLQPQRLLLVASETSLMASIRLHCITRIIRSLFCKFPQLRFRNIADLSFYGTILNFWVL